MRIIPLKVFVTKPFFHNWLRRFFWKHPEWWAIVLAVLAWGFTLLHANTHYKHVFHSMPFEDSLINWCLMAVAMMVPLIIKQLRWVAFQNYRHRRHKAVIFFLLGFLWPWFLAGIAVAGLGVFDWFHNPLLATGMFALAALWVLTPLRKRMLTYCHMTIPLAPEGWQANRDCLRYGVIIGMACLVTCSLMMLGCVSTGHNIIAMVVGVVLARRERLAFRPSTKQTFIGTLLLAVWFLLPFSYSLPFWF